MEQQNGTEEEEEQYKRKEGWNSRMEQRCEQVEWKNKEEQQKRKEGWNSRMEK